MVARSIKDYLWIMLKGVGMGAADVVPGVSGGTIAFITGVYDELLHSLKSINPRVLVTLHQQGIAAAWKEINGNFLLALFGGVLVSFKIFAAIVGAALDSYPIVVWAFFMGLILASIYVFSKEQTAWAGKHWFACILGALVVVAISIMTPAQLPSIWWVVFLGGFVAICAMILPGISGSFILMLAGLYTVVIDAINQTNLLLIASFLVGCVCGLLAFSRFLSWLLMHHHKATFALLIGFLIGSLKVIWPWKLTVAYFQNRHGEMVPLEQVNILPARYAMETGNDAMLGLAIVASLTGMLLVLFTDYKCKKIKK